MVKWVIIIILGLLIFTACSSALILFKDQPLPEPTGPYKVGTLLLDVEDTDRLESLVNSGENRRLAIQVFYPAASDSTGNYLPSMDPRLGKAFADLYKIPMGSGNSLPSHSIMDAETVKGESYPVILFSHGGFSFNTQNLSTYEELASHGYIVLAISHTYEAILTIFSDTESINASDLSYMKNTSKISRKILKSYKQDLRILKTAVSQNEKKETLQRLAGGFYGELRPYLEIRLQDVRFVLNQLEVWNQLDYAFSGHMDLKKIGMFGHSLGGITTGYICSEKDTPVQAGINLDAPVVLYPGYDLDLQSTFAFFYSTETTLPKIGALDMTGTNSYYKELTGQKVFSLSFKDSSHYNFSDFNFMPGIMRWTPMLGNVKGPVMAKEMNRAILEFFNYSLKADEDNLFGKGHSASDIFTLE